MSERRKQSEFLKHMIQCECEESLYEIQEKIHEAEKQEKCVSSALRLVLVVGMIAVCGLGYSVVFLQDFFISPSNIFIRIFSAIGLGSAICLVAFAGCWFWYRANVNRLYDEGRDLVMHVVENRYLESEVLPQAQLIPVPNQDTEPDEEIQSRGNLVSKFPQASVYS